MGKCIIVISEKAAWYFYLEYFKYHYDKKNIQLYRSNNCTSQIIIFMNHNLIKGERCPVIIYLYSGCPAKLDNCVVFDFKQLKKY